MHGVTHIKDIKWGLTYVTTVSYRDLILVSLPN
jgi:hypothetical protein